jgi:hypothetical protein
MTNKKTIEGIRMIARDTQKVKIFDKVAYARIGSNAVLDLLSEAERYQERYMHDFSIYENAYIEYANIDIEELRTWSEKKAEEEHDDEDRIFYREFEKTIKNINLPYWKIMECILDEIGYYHEIYLYDGSEWYDDSEIDIIDYDNDVKGTFTLKEDEE